MTLPTRLFTRLAADLPADYLARYPGPQHLGAHVLVDHTTDDVVDSVNQATDGRGADLVFDGVGLPDVALACLGLVTIRMLATTMGSTRRHVAAGPVTEQP